MLYKKILIIRRVFQQDRTDGHTHTHTLTLTHRHSTASCDSYIELTASGLDNQKDAQGQHVEPFLLYRLFRTNYWAFNVSV